MISTIDEQILANYLTKYMKKYGLSVEFVAQKSKTPVSCDTGVNSPSWARTNDTAVNSRVLCQLSYGGMKERSGWNV